MTSLSGISIALFAALASTAGAQEQSASERAAELRSGGISWFVQNQNEDGSWGSHKSGRSMELIAAVPGTHNAYRVGCTGLAVIALLEVPEQSDETRASVSKAIDYLLKHCDVKRPNAMEFFNTWAFAYSMHAFGEWLIRHPTDPRVADVEQRVRELLRRLETYQCLDGGFGYLELDQLKTRQPSFTSMSFTTATVLVAIDRVREAGLRFNAARQDKALRSVASCRMPGGAFTYGPMWNAQPVSGINVSKGAACRTPQCQYALSLFGQPTPQPEQIEALEWLLVDHAHFQRIGVRRPIPHEAWYAISGYFYLYGHAYAAMVLEGLPEEVQDRLWPTMVEAVAFCHQPDGSFWDYPVYSYHKPYGTAFALMALSRVPTD